MIRPYSKVLLEFDTEDPSLVFHLFRNAQIYVSVILRLIFKRECMYYLNIHLTNDNFDYNFNISPIGTDLYIFVG